MPNPQYTLKTVDRVFDLLRVLVESARPMSLSEIAEAADISTSNAFRFLKTLEASGHITRDDNKRYTSVSGGGGEIGLTRGMQILDLIAAAPNGSLRTEVLAAALDVDVPQLERAMQKLVVATAVEHVAATDAWRLSTGMMRFLRPLMNDHVLARFIRPLMVDLGRMHRETVSWYVAHGWEQVVVDVLPSPQPIRYVLETGARQPGYLGAAGKAHLAALPEADVARFLKDLEPVQLTGFRLDKQALADELKVIRARGYAQSDSERVEGAVSVAVSVTGPEDRALGVISVMMPKFRKSPEELRAIGETLKARVETLFAPRDINMPQAYGKENG